MNRKNKENEEICYSLLKGNKSFGSLSNIVRDKNIPRTMKLQVYKTIVRPVLLYRCGEWVMKKAEEETLVVWERKVPRKIYGGAKEGQV